MGKKLSSLVSVIMNTVQTVQQLRAFPINTFSRTNITNPLHGFVCIRAHYRSGVVNQTCLAFILDSSSNLIQRVIIAVIVRQTWFLAHQQFQSAEVSYEHT
jgi:hypothetical protein